MSLHNYQGRTPEQVAADERAACWIWGIGVAFVVVLVAFVLIRAAVKS